MNEEKINEVINKFYVDEIDLSSVVEILELNPLERLKYFQVRLLDFTGTPEITALVRDLIEHFEKLQKENPEPEFSDYFAEKIDEAFISVIRNNISGSIWLFTLHSFLQSILSTQFSRLDVDVLKKLRADHNLTNKKFTEILSENFSFHIVPEKPEEKRKKIDWDGIYFLSHYERFLIVIKNARKEFKQLIGKRVRESTAEKEIIKRYEIPNELTDSLFRWSDKPKFHRKDRQIALQWAKNEIRIYAADSSIEKYTLKNAKESLAQIIGNKQKPSFVKLFSVGTHQQESGYIFKKTTSDQYIVNTYTNEMCSLLKFPQPKLKRIKNELPTFHFINTNKKFICKFEPGTKEFDECPNCKNRRM